MKGVDGIEEKKRSRRVEMAVRERKPLADPLSVKGSSKTGLNFQKTISNVEV